MRATLIFAALIATAALRPPLTCCAPTTPTTARSAVFLQEKPPKKENLGEWRPGDEPSWQKFFAGFMVGFKASQKPSTLDETKPAEGGGDDAGE